MVVHAPELDRPGLLWLNTDAPLGLDRLRGRLVVLDFWTFCCINCIQIIPTLRRVEQTFPDEVVVIGVHSPKFEAERDPAAVAKAVARYGIRHPVVHDPGMVLWQQFAVRAWPTLVFVGPEGAIVGQTSGEPDPDRLVAAIGEVLRQYREAGRITPETLDLADPPEPSGRLRYPGKIKPVPGPSKRWALADSGHNRILLLDDGGVEIETFGSGEVGFEDGPAEVATFDGPQGLVADEDAIYVADTGNHAVRRIDLATGSVTTLAGNGRRGPALDTMARPGGDTALASPWDLELRERHLYIANAGTHQLLLLDLGDGSVRRAAGTGGENIVDGPPDAALLAQPSGLALSADATTLYFADSETSSIRALDLASCEVRTLVGTGLFDFGHRNGDFARTLLQHPLGLAVLDERRIVVADSYNGALRLLDLAAETTRDIGTGQALCTDPVCLPLDEPAGVAADGPDRLLVVDTNNHRVLAYDLAAGRYGTWVD